MRKTVKKVSCNEIETDYGEFNVHLYQDLISKTSHLALVKGDIDKEKPTLVRVHVQNTIQDIIHTKNSKSWPLENAIKKINNSDAGVLLILRWPESQEDLENAINKVTNPDFSKNIYDRRALGVGGQILFDLNVGKMMLMSAPQNFYGLGGFGLEIVDYVTE